MTAIELVKKLQEFPENTKILVDGYESGYNDISCVYEIIVHHRENVDWWNGNYEEVELSNHKMDKVISAIALGGKDR